MTPKIEKCSHTPDNLHRSPKTEADGLANLGAPARAQSNISRRGRKSRGVASAEEVAFCVDVVLSGNVRQASLRAGHSAGWGYELLKLPRIRSVLREFQKRKEALRTAKSRTALTGELLDELFRQRIVNMTTDRTGGDLKNANMFETGYKRAGTAEAKAGSSAQTPDIYARRLYLPTWRKEVIERLMKKDIEAGREPTGLVPDSE